MQTEWEATFWPIEKNEVRARLTVAGAVQSYPERLMRRANLYPPDEDYARRAWVRVRDEGDRITLSVKETLGTGMAEQKEVQLVIDDFETARDLLRSLGCRDKNYQETRRELWLLDDAEITIDEWPYLAPLVEVEGASEEHVRMVSEKIGFTWSDARFCSADKIYAEHYGVESSFVNRSIPRLTFEDPNPFTGTAGK